MHGWKGQRNNHFSSNTDWWHNQWLIQILSDVPIIIRHYTLILRRYSINTTIQKFGITFLIGSRFYFCIELTKNNAKNELLFEIVAVFTCTQHHSSLLRNRCDTSSLQNDCWFATTETFLITSALFEMVLWLMKCGNGNTMSFFSFWNIEYTFPQVQFWFQKETAFPRNSAGFCCLHPPSRKKTDDWIQAGQREKWTT